MALSTQTAPLPASFTVPCNAIYTENDDAAFLASKVRSSKRRSKASLSTASARTWAPEKLQIFLLQGHFLSSTEKFSDIEERRNFRIDLSPSPACPPWAWRACLANLGTDTGVVPFLTWAKLGRKKAAEKLENTPLWPKLSPFLLRSLDYSFSVSLSRLGCLFLFFAVSESRLCNPMPYGAKKCV